MSSFATEIRVDAPVEDVWQALADIGSIYRWNPGVISSHLITDEATGIGACRYCDLGSGNYLDEEVVDWEAGERLTMRITRTNLPFKAAEIRFTLQAESGLTLVTVSPEYELKYGLLGGLLDTLFVRRTYRKGMDALLAGLKEHIESGEPS